jgi:hypothetical protein
MLKLVYVKFFFFSASDRCSEFLLDRVCVPVCIRCVRFVFLPVAKLRRLAAKASISL